MNIPSPTSSVAAAAVIVRNTIALNNIGTNLLDKHCYGQALQTFKDALSIVKQSVSTTNASSNGNNINNESLSALSRNDYEVSYKLYHNALKRLLRPQPHTDHVALIDVVTWNSGEASCFYNDENSKDQMLLGESLSSLSPLNSILTIHPFRIEDIDSCLDDCCSNHDNSSSSADDDTTSSGDLAASSSLSESMFTESLNFESSILLHNLGLAYFCMASAGVQRNNKRIIRSKESRSKVTNDSHNHRDYNDAGRKRYLSMAASLFRMSNSISSKSIMNDGGIVSTTTSRGRRILYSPLTHHNTMLHFIVRNNHTLVDTLMRKSNQLGEGYYLNQSVTNFERTIQSIERWNGLLLSTSCISNHHSMAAAA